MRDDASINTREEKHQIALEKLTQAQLFFLKKKDSANLAMTYYFLGVVNYYVIRRSKTKEYMIKCIAFEKFMPKKYIPKIYQNIASVNLEEGIIHKNDSLIKSAIGNYKKVIKIYDKYGWRTFQAQAISLLGETYNQLGFKKKYLTLLDSAIFLAKNAGSLNQEAFALLKKAHLFNNFGRNEEALIIVSRVKEIFEKEIQDNSMLLYTYNVEQILYDSMKNYKAKSEVYAKLFDVTRKVYQTELADKVAEMDVKFGTAIKEQKIALQDAEIKEQKALISRNRILLASSFGLVGLLIVIGLLWRNRMKKKQQIALQSQKIASKEAEINAVISSQEKERSRYARDLHDGFGQMISILKMNLQGLQGNSNLEEQHQVYENSKGVIDDMYAELKNICFDMMPQTLIKNGLTNALEEFASRVNTPQKVFLELNIFGLDKRLNEVQEISLYRIIQEWVNNILKYSDATKITVQITKDQKELNLLIEDNGMGFDSNLLKQGKGNGWKNMNTRANLINGEIILETKEGIRGNTFILDAVLDKIKQKEKLNF